MKKKQDIVKVESNNNELILSEIEKLEQYSLREIEEYGASIQSNIDENCTSILNAVSNSDLGKTGEMLNELQSVTSKQNKKMPLQLRIFSNKITDRYIKAQSKIDSITEQIVEQKNYMTTMIDNMATQSSNLYAASAKLKECEAVLSAYAEKLQNENEEDTQIRLQSVANRLKLITSARVNAEQANVQALMIIKTNQESQYQLNQVIQNVIPVLKMQAVNSLGIKANREAVEIADKTKKITSELIAKNAQDIKSLAVDLENNRNNNLIDENKLKEAQNTLKEAIEMVTKASELEATNNLRIAKDLAETSLLNEEYIRILSQNK